ncbi:Salicylate hydroxylase [Grifola frondosa]|uniref:Salicylate hydroxylase n=1 Tax=Grifola frondosa TaxID=5627 RepID=A0A1C7M5B1_GRIFR|nr:Salicylate hydroxylase [Grifola frondosa]
MNDKKLRVAVIGAGIGGLTFALSLHKTGADVEVNIYESASKFTEIGAGIGIWPRVWEIIKSLGLEDDLLPIAGNAGMQRPAGFIYRKSNQHAGVPLYEADSDFGVLTFHRAELQQALIKHLPPSYSVHFHKRLSDYVEPESGPILLKFEDSTTATCDIVIGCDGIKSNVRATMYRSFAAEAQQAGDDVKATTLRAHADPIWLGTIAYRGLIPRVVLETVQKNHRAIHTPTMYLGKYKYLVVYPVSRGQEINVVVFVSKPELEGTTYEGPWVSCATSDEVLQAFAEWEPEVKTLLTCLNHPSRWAINVATSLPTYVRGRVAILGDAAHAMAPHLGSGAGQAIEVGWPHPCRSSCAFGSDSRTLPLALKVYDEIRRPFSQKVQQGSKEAGMLYEFINIGDDVGDENHAPSELNFGEALERLLGWTATGSAMGDRQRALQMVAECIRQV